MAVRLLACLALASFAVPATAQDDLLAEAERFGEENTGGVVEEHAGEGHGEHPEGLPVEPRADLALWSGIVFLLFVGVLTAMAWKPAAAGLDKREERIRSDLAAAEKHRVESERLMSQHSAEMAKAQDQVKEILAEARRDAEVAKANILAEAQAAAKTERERALHDIEQAKDQAMAELFAGFNDQLAAATEQVLGKSLTDETQQRLIDQSIAEFRGSRA
ncbi:hypothetical protein [Alienimonas sp. DA493]|uniref:F0F1 ATP synthase subunit B family protein n=1 Tax=Alienimonas sp. DA493 TaxID=3373605 RepID=UPI003754E70F